MNIQAVLELARAKTGAKSDRALAKRLSLSPTGLVVLLAGRHYPSDEVMLRIAEAAGLAEDEALLMLNMWRAKGRARTIYGKLHQQLIAASADGKSRKRLAATNQEQIAQ